MSPESSGNDYHAYCRRCAYDLDVLLSGQPGLKPVACQNIAKTPASTDLEYLDVFGFFNMPRLPHPVQQEVTSGTNQAPLLDPTAVNELNITDYLVPTPESDWLGRENTFWT